MYKSTSVSSGNGSWPEQLAVKVARYYYELGMTQQDIASHIGIGRARVIKLLSEARERGVVSIRITSPLLENVRLEEELVSRYELNSAHVTLTNTEDSINLATQLAGFACDVIKRELRDCMTIGLGRGCSITALADQLEPLSYSGVSVVSLLGALTARASVSRHEATTGLASKLDAERLYLPAPVVCDSVDSLKLLSEQPVFQGVRSRALNSELAIVSVGALDIATLHWLGLTDEKELIGLRECGAIGNFLGYFIDAGGRVVNHPVNERIAGIKGTEFKSIPQRVLLSAGKSNLQPLRAVLEKGLVTSLITDQSTALELLEQADSLMPVD